MIQGPKLSNFKIGGLILQKDKNKRSKTAIKHQVVFTMYITLIQLSHILFQLYTN